MQIINARTSTHLNEIRTIFREYEQFLNVDLCFQGFEEELANLPGKYAPPAGELFLAVEDENVAGCVAVRALEGDVCEMKRLFTRPSYRGRGLGRQLAEKIISEAEKLGFKTVYVSKNNKIGLKNPNINIELVSRIEDVVSGLFG